MEEDIRTQTLSGYATGPGGAGFVRLQLSISGDRIAGATWESNGCPAAHKASNGLATFLRGRTLEQASRIEPNDLLILIGGLPDGKGQYATIAVDALQNALPSITTSTPQGQDHGSGEQSEPGQENK